MKKILVAGCTGYIGSHICVELLENNYDVIGMDDFSNSKKYILKNITKITNKKIKFYEGNMLDKSLLDKIFQENNIDLVIDLVAYKDISESLIKPLEYYTNNVSSVLNLLSSMKEHNIKSLIFSSSVSVYGKANTIPIREDCELKKTTNPYGTSKQFVEKILQDLQTSDLTWNICIFRYSNPIGAHFTGLIGDESTNNSTNLMSSIAKVVKENLDCLNVYGNDYATKDGTGIRDYIHIMDLAKAHVNAIKKLEKEKRGIYIYNLGTNKGYSVLDVINTFEKANNVKINYKIVNRRKGDTDICILSSKKAQKELNWQAMYDLEKMCKDSYNYIIKTK